MRNFLKKTGLMLAIACLTAANTVSYAIPETSYYSASEPYEGWKINGDGTTLSLENDPISDYGMKITKGVVAEEGKVYLELNDQSKPDGIFILEYDFMLPQAAPCYIGALFGYENGALKKVNQFRTTSSGGIILGTAADAPVEKAVYKTGEWNHVKQIVDLENNKTHFYLNDKRIGSADNGGILNKLSRFDFGFHEAAAANSVLNIDNVELYAADGSKVYFSDYFFAENISAEWKLKNAVAESLEKSENKCMKISRETTQNAKGQAMYYFPEESKPAGSFVIEYKFNLPQNAAAYIGDMWCYKGGFLDRMGYFRTTSTGGVIIDSKTQSVLNNVTYEANKWNKVKQIVDFDKNETAYYFNNKYIGTVPISEDMQMLTRLDFGFYEAAPTNIMLYIDDVKVYQNDSSLKLSVDSRVCTNINNIKDNSTIAAEVEMPWNDEKTGAMIIGFYENGVLKNINISSGTGLGYYKAMVNCGELSENAEYEVKIFRLSDMREITPTYESKTYKKQ